MYYAGSHYFPQHDEEEKYVVPLAWNDPEYENYESSEYDDIQTVIRTYDYNEYVEIFLETDGENVTFSLLLHGKLYKKISKDKEKVIFYNTNFRMLDSNDLEQEKDPLNLVFENRNGEYRDRIYGTVFIPPQMPDSIDKDSALQLCKDYINACYVARDAAFPVMKEYRTENGYLFRGIEGEGHLFQAETDEFILKAEFDSPVSPVAFMTAYHVAPSCIHLKSASFMESGLNVTFFWTDDFSLKIDIEDPRLKVPFHTDFETLKKINIFSNVNLSGMAVFNSDFGAFVRDISTYLKIKKALVAYGIDNIEFYQTKRSQKDVDMSLNQDSDTVMAMRKRLREQLKAKVKGQDLAVEKFVDGYIRYQIRGKVPGKPACVFLFAGPPGTGKTYLAETFTGIMAHEGYQYKRFDMAAYSGSNDIVTGLVGFEKTWRGAQPGQLTEFVKMNPKCVLLFDEIEKASAQVRYLFLSILEGAVLTDRFYDEQVSFEDAILIFTTNEGKDLYEDNRRANLTALPDPVVIDGLRASRFAPELISRFMSGTVIMFNHLSYSHMMDLFEASMNDELHSVRIKDLDYKFQYENELPKLYILSKGDQIDARFVGANTKQMVDDFFLKAIETIKNEHAGNLDWIKNILVSVNVGEEVREYFKMTQKPRILGYTDGDTVYYVGKAAYMHNGSSTQKGREALCQMADCDWAGSRESFKESLQGCNWNSRSREDRYDAVLIDLADEDDTGEGYACLKAAVEEKRDIPIIIVDRKEEGKIERTLLAELGVTDFVRGITYKPQQGNTGNSDNDKESQERDGILLDREELETILDRQHFVEMALLLARKNQRISSSVVYKWNERSGLLNICFDKLCVKAATEEDAEDRRQDRRYLLENKPQVRVEDIFGGELVKKAVRRCIDNIKNPGKYREAGARLMKGILMYGAPGMGKTMFAKAMAYESGAAFISAVGADFLNENGIVKMEEMFRTARRKKPCIFFIDEFDAISKDRNGGVTSTQEAVLEKFLKEMDGLETDNEGIYVVGATNYPLEALDSAVTRRFSAKILFPYPNMREREEFLFHILEKKGLKSKISERAAKTLNLMMYRKMRNYSEIETFIEESIAEAVYQGVDVTERFLFNRVHDETYGAARSERNQEEFMVTAFHEAGHAVLQYYFGLKNDYVTIVPRGDYNGYALAQSRLYSGQDFLNQICISMAGRISEMKFLELMGTDSRAGINVGAESDMQKATQIAYDYVCRYGMSGRMVVVPERFLSQINNCHEDVLPESEKEAIWASVNQVLEQQWKLTEQRLQKWWGEVWALAFSLMNMQELDGKTLEEVIQTRIPHVEESCFWDSDDDYKKPFENGGMMIPSGFPIYPSPIRMKPGEERITAIDSRHYYYAVKKAKGGLGIYENLQEAYAEAVKKDAHCRRFQREEAAREYLEMLEIKAFRRGERRFCGFYVDALAEMDDSSAAKKDVTIVKGELSDKIREEAFEAKMPVAQYLMESMEDNLDKYEDIHIVVQVYDADIRDELLYYMDFMEEQAVRYHRNLGV